MKSIFLFDEHNSSVHNGIGTFLHCFSACLKEDVDVTMLSLNDNVQIITSEASKGVHFLRFPIYCNGAFLYNTKPAVTILRTEIEDTPENVFIINHFPCNTLLQELKMYFPLSKRVFVIHDHLWTESLKGDDTCLRKIILENCEESGKKSEEGFEIFLRAKTTKYSILGFFNRKRGQFSGVPCL